MTTQPLKPTRTLAEVIDRFRKRLDEQAAPLPKPVSDEVPPPPFQDTDTQQDEEDAG